MDYSSSYANALDAIAPGITDEVAAAQGQGESWVDTLAKVLPVLATTYQQRQLLEIQLQRAQQGLPPLDVSQYSPGVQVGLTNDTRMWLMIGGVVLAIAFVLPAVLKHR